MRIDRRKLVLLFGTAAMLAGTPLRAEEQGAWRDIRPWLFDDRPIEVRVSLCHLADLHYLARTG